MSKCFTHLPRAPLPIPQWHPITLGPAPNTVSTSQGSVTFPAPCPVPVPAALQDVV